MQKSLTSLLLGGIVCSCLFGSSIVCAEEPDRSVPDAIVIEAADAEFTEGEGVSFENEKAATAYDEEHGMIINLAKIRSVSPSVNGRFEAKLLNGEVAVISRQYVSVLKRKLGM